MALITLNLSNPPLEPKVTSAVVRASSSPFDASSRGRRTKGWSYTTDSVNSILHGHHDRLRAHCRDSIRKSSWAASIIDSYTANAIGTGIKPLSQHEDEATRAAIHKAWRRWTDEADFDERTDFYGLQALAFREMYEAGEVLVRIHITPESLTSTSKSSTTPLQIQLLESDHLPYDEYLIKRSSPVEGNDIRYGVEFSPRGKRVAYHIYTEHPGELQGLSGKKVGLETVRVPSAEMLHIFKPLRAGQVRGQPHLTQVLLALRDLDDYTDAARMRKKISSLFAGFVTKASSGDVIPAENLGEGIGQVEVEAGTLYNLQPGEDVSWSAPPDETGFADFVKSNLRAIAAGAGVTYEQVSGDLEDVNYSSIRAGLLEFRRKCEQLQHQVFVFQFCRPIFRQWLPLAVLSGSLKLPYFSMRNIEDYLDVKWMTPGWQWVDPEAESKAALNDVRSGFTSRAAVVASKGEDIEEIDREQATDNARADKLGLPYDSDPRKELKAMEKQGKVDEGKIEKQGEVQKEVDAAKPKPTSPASKPKSNGRADYAH